MWADAIAWRRQRRTTHLALVTDSGSLTAQNVRRGRWADANGRRCISAARRLVCKECDSTVCGDKGCKGEWGSAGKAQSRLHAATVLPCAWQRLSVRLCVLSIGGCVATPAAWLCSACQPCCGKLGCTLWLIATCSCRVLVLWGVRRRTHRWWWGWLGVCTIVCRTALSLWHWILSIYLL